MPDNAGHTEALGETIADLVAWFDRYGLAGYDPYDVYDHPVMRLLRRTRGTRISGAWTTADRAVQRNPHGARRLLRQKPHENSKAVGLLLGAWTRLQTAGLRAWPEDGATLVDWLDQHRHTDYPGASWSYPFAFRSRINFPPGTPYSITTAICGEALLDYAIYRKDDLARGLAHEVGVFIADALPRYTTEHGVYLPYTPIDDFAVHNVSISLGALLARLARDFDAPAWAELAHEVLQFTLSEQRDDGAFEYWAAHQSTGRHVDNYHTGFVLRALLQYEDLGYAEASAPLERAWAHYAREFVRADGTVRTIEGQYLPVNIHACAESILCGATLADRFPDALDLAERAYRWTAENLRNDDGSFGYGIFGYGYQPMAYTRWGEAWMLRALAELTCASPANGR